MSDLSEYAARPRYLVLHNPGIFNELKGVSAKSLTKYHYLHVPDVRELYEQHESFRTALRDSETNTLEFTELLSESQRQHLADLCDPNAMFTRDPAITLPWQPKVFIPARFALGSRVGAGVLFHKALTNFGLRRICHFKDDEFIEGGDVIPLWHSGKRILLVGYGTRTTRAGVEALARQLVPEYADIVVGLYHKESVLHLDTGFALLSGRSALCASGMFRGGFIADARGSQQIKPGEYFTDIGLNLIEVDKDQAVEHEICNMLPIGSGRFVSFEIPGKLRHKIHGAGIDLHEIDGDELAKAAGGTHCLSRPVY